LLSYSDFRLLGILVFDAAPEEFPGNIASLRICLNDEIVVLLLFFYNSQLFLVLGLKMWLNLNR
jgi:hypothetical protein